RRLALQHRVTRILAESPGLAEAVPRILQALCEGLGWDVGALWQVDRGPAPCLRLAHLWHSPGAAVPGFAARSRETAFAPGVGLPGRVWAAGKPAWVTDV